MVIKEADKGGNVDILPEDMYVVEVFRQLNNATYYCKLPSDPTSVYKRKLDEILEWGLDQKVIDHLEFRFLSQEHPVIPTFYILPKIHKHPTQPPGRPIGAGIGSLTEPSCIFIDHFLQPHVLCLDS